MALIAGDVVGEEIVNVSTGVISEVGRIGNWMEALGIGLIIWLVLQLISYAYNRKRIQEIFEIRKDMNRIEKKIDSLLNKKK